VIECMAIGLCNEEVCMDHMQQCPEVVERGRGCAITIYRISEKRLEEDSGRHRDMMEVVKPDESWEGK